MVEGSTMVRHRPLTMPYHRATMILQIGFQYLIVHKRMTPHEMTRARGGLLVQSKRLRETLIKSQNQILRFSQCFPNPVPVARGL